MPTTQQEAKKIKQIADEFMAEKDAREFTKRLHEEVGLNTDNNSLAISLQMFHMLYDPLVKRRVKTAKFLLYSVIATHFTIIIFNTIAFFLLPFYASWYVALPIMTLIVNFMFTSNPCPLTRLEDNIRGKLGMKQIRLFMGHYIVWPTKAWLKERKKKKDAEGSEGSTGIKTTAD